MTDTLKVTKSEAKQHEDVKDGADTSAVQLPPGSYSLDDLHKAAASDNRAEAMAKCNKTATERGEPGVPPGSKRVLVKDEISGVTEKRVVSKMASEREGDEPKAAPDPAPAPSAPKTTTPEPKASDASTSSDTDSLKKPAFSGQPKE